MAIYIELKPFVCHSKCTSEMVSFVQLNIPNISNTTVYLWLCVQRLNRTRAFSVSFSLSKDLFWSTRSGYSVKWTSTWIIAQKMIALKKNCTKYLLTFKNFVSNKVYEYTYSLKFLRYSAFFVTQTNLAESLYFEYFLAQFAIYRVNETLQWNTSRSWTNELFWCLWMKP